MIQRQRHLIRGNQSRHERSGVDDMLVAEHLDSRIAQHDVHLGESALERVEARGH